jgi:hypothetical protein
MQERGADGRVWSWEERVGRRGAFGGGGSVRRDEGGSDDGALTLWTLLSISTPPGYSPTLSTPFLSFFSLFFLLLLIVVDR